MRETLEREEQEHIAMANYGMATSARPPTAPWRMPQPAPPTPPPSQHQKLHRQQLYQKDPLLWPHHRSRLCHPGLTLWAMTWSCLLEGSWWCNKNSKKSQAKQTWWHGKKYIFFFIFRYMDCYPLAEGSLEVKLPTIWTHEKQRWEQSEKRREEEREKIREEKEREERRCRCAKR